MKKTIAIFCTLVILSCSSQKKLSTKKAKSFDSKTLIGFYEDGCTEYPEAGKRVISCPFMDLGDPESNPKYEIRMMNKTSGYYILHHGKNYDRPAKRDTSQLSILTKNKETIMQIISKRDTVFEIIESITPDTLITRNALHDVRYFYPRLTSK